MTPTEACEAVFQKHKQNGGSVRWTKETFRDYPSSVIDNAKDSMLKQGIIFNGQRERTTVIAPEYAECKSFDEANRLWVEIKNKSHRPTQTTITVGRDNSGNIITGNSNQSSSSLPTPALPDENSSHPIRLIRIKEVIDYGKGSIVKYRLITWKQFLQETQWKVYGHAIERHPYKWWQLQYLFEVPAFYLVHFFSPKTLV